MKPRLILSMKLPTPICLSSTAPFSISIPNCPPKPCKNYWLWYQLTHPGNHYCLPLLHCQPMSSTTISTSHQWSSSNSRKQYCWYLTPSTKWLWPFQNYFPPKQPDLQGWHPDCYKIVHDKNTLNLTSPIKQSPPVLPDFHRIDP